RKGDSEHSAAARPRYGRRDGTGCPRGTRLRYPVRPAPIALRMPASARPSLSACVITLDEADRIEACLDSLAFCDELVVVDSGSTDGTRERAAAKGARVIER